MAARHTRTPRRRAPSRYRLRYTEDTSFRNRSRAIRPATDSFLLACADEIGIGRAQDVVALCARRAEHRCADKDVVGQHVAGHVFVAAGLQGVLRADEGVIDDQVGPAMGD